MEVICLEEKAFYALLDEVVERVKEKHQRPKEHRWISRDEAMEMLGISGKDTLARLRNEGKIGYSQPTPQIFMYDRESIEAHLERKSFKPFDE